MSRKMVFEILAVLVLLGALMLSFNIQPVKATGTPTPPEAKFSVLLDAVSSDPTYYRYPSHAGHPLTFDASYSLPGWNGTHAMPIEYHWDFGDGNMTSTLNPIITHRYSFSGAYDVRLTVQDSQGLNSSTTKVVFILMPTSISISTSPSSTFVGFKVNINGTLKDIYKNGVAGKTVTLSYIFPGTYNYIPITSATTDNLGKYNIVWIPPATGYFTLRVEYEGWWMSVISGTTFLGAYNTTTLSSLPYNDQQVFSVESNSTITEFAFNCTSRQLSFTATGSDGTKGYAGVTISKTLFDNPADVRVYLDGEQINYTITSLDDSWLLSFTYQHSTHKISITVPTPTPFIQTLLGKALVLGLSTTAIAILILLILRKKHRQAQTNQRKENLGHTQT